MECQQATPAAPVASAPTRRAPAARGQGETRQQASGPGGGPVALGRWTDPLATVLASAVARRSSDDGAGPVLARKTTIRDDPADNSRGIHAEFVGTPKEQINPHIHYGPLLNDCATSMDGWLFPDLDFEGSGPKAGTWPWWWTDGGNAPDNTDYWVRGHLLNETLGGPGEPRNLTPITKQCNSRHHSLVEALCKHAFGQGQLVVYTVVPRYDGVGPPLASIAKNPHYSAWPYLATHLDCEWSFMDGNGNPKGHGSVAVPNTH